MRGPGGMRYEEYEYAAESAALEDLLPGKWELRADGIGVNGEPGWTSKRTTVTVAEGQSIAITIKLNPVTEE